MSMSERDQQIWRLACKAVDALGFALQNTHSDGIAERYERQSEEAMNELHALLATQRPAQPGGKQA